MSNGGNPWTLRATKRIYDNPWIRVDEHDVLDAGGNQRCYGIVRFKKIAVGVLPLFEDGSVGLVGQYRLPLEAYSWEMPEGGSEAGEDVLATARRELQEESGLEASAITEILRMHLSNSVTDEYAVIYLATGLTQGAPNPDEDEVLTFRRAAFGDVLAEVLDGRITDSLTVAAILRVHHMAATGGLAPSLAQMILA